MLLRTSILAGAAVVWLAGSVAAQQTRLSTLFASDNRGDAGGAVYFDIAASQPVLVWDFELNVTGAEGTPIQVGVFALPQGTSHVGNEELPAWAPLASDDGTARAAGLDRPSLVRLDAPILIAAGTRGLAIVVTGAGHAYTNGTGNNQSYGDGILSLSLGAASHVPFVGPIFAPRVWNGSVGYTLAQGVQPWFSVSARAGPSPLTVTFEDASFTDDPAGFSAWDWDIDSDGTYEYSGSSAQHTYATGGLYSITLRVTDSLHGGTPITRTDLIEVDPIAVDFDWNVVPGTATSLQFQDTSVPSPATWSWDFDGDGNADSTQQNPVFDYATPGIFRCTLTVATATNSAIRTKVVRVQTLPLPDFVDTYSYPIHTRGYWFQAPGRFSIVAVEVPDEIGAGLQNVAIYLLPSAPPAAPATFSGNLRFYVAGAVSGGQIRTAISFAPGEFVGVLGSTGDALDSHSSYGANNFITSLFGAPVTLRRLRSDANLVTSGGGAPLTSSGGSIARVELAITSATSEEYGLGTASGTGAAVPTLTTTALPMLGQVATLRYTQNDPAGIAAFLVAFGRGSTLTPYGELLVDPVSSFSLFLGTVLAGPGELSLTIPNQPAFQGAGPMCWQALFGIPGAPNVIAFTNAVEWYFGR